MSRSLPPPCRRWRLDRRVAGAALLALGAAQAADDAAQGRRLFVGDAPLPARIAGQDFELPARASRCANCHLGAAPRPASGATLTGPALDARSLTQPQRRRGGPPSTYDIASFCTLLRTGVDPAYVVIERTMPRYVVSDADCRALWQHLTTAR